MGTDEWLKVLAGLLGVLTTAGAALWMVHVYHSRRSDETTNAIHQRIDDVDSAVSQRVREAHAEAARRAAEAEEAANKRIQEVNAHVETLNREINEVRKNAVGPEQFRQLHEDIQTMGRNMNARIDQVLQILVEQNHSRSGGGGRSGE